MLIKPLLLCEGQFDDLLSYTLITAPDFLLRHLFISSERFRLLQLCGKCSAAADGSTQVVETETNSF